MLRGKSRTRSEGDVVAGPDGGGPVAVQGRSVAYCSKLTTDEAREVANAVSGLPRHPSGFTLMYVIADPDSKSNPATISFDPYLPDGRFLLHGGGR